MSVSPKRALTPQEYLALERDVPTKHEFHRGEMFAMSGASHEHNQITFNLAAALHGQLNNRNCTAYVSDMRVKVASTGSYVYPDAVVTCQKPRFEDGQLDTLLNPQIIVEVLSPSTEGYDRGKKFEHYRQIDSLQEYVLVAQDRAHVEHYARSSGGGWLLSEATGLEATLQLPTIECQLDLADIYAKVEFPPPAPPENIPGLFPDDRVR